MKKIQRHMKIVTQLLTVLLLMSFHASGMVQAAENEKDMLRLALLPIPDVLPVYVAQEKGYFKEAGIVVEPLPVGSAVERDQLMQAGRIDGMINEVSGAALFNRQSPQMQIISYARIPAENAPLFRVLAAPGSKVSEVKELAQVPIGVSKNTVIEYITERLLEKGGVPTADIVTRSVPVLPERLQLLLAGQIPAATLPDPLGFAAIQAGAVEVVSDLEAKDLSASVISFSMQSISEKEQTVAKFMVAWDKAAADLNADPESFRALMLSKIRVPKNVRQTFAIPPIPRGKTVSRDQWEDAVKWLIAKKILKEPVAYEDSVTDRFLIK
ncbi:ABC transporter substrate-binding protein [Desulfopila sp. IMCC35008]|uniref:ABC transporter substrate-binding protein n=1 Tax=Desulfopila sp. IMCC35008 TaxID=2653858 RepID=UPI0013D168ED|nr:ABC transporter substrate-binding protein [Desulfopila sp. IMCC35008]